jgi:hypothetical protein
MRAELRLSETLQRRLCTVGVAPEGTAFCPQEVDALLDVVVLSNPIHPISCLSQCSIAPASAHIPTSAQNRPCPNRLLQRQHDLYEKQRPRQFSLGV